LLAGQDFRRDQECEAGASRSILRSSKWRSVGAQPAGDQVAMCRVPESLVEQFIFECDSRSRLAAFRLFCQGRVQKFYRCIMVDVVIDWSTARHLSIEIRDQCILHNEVCVVSMLKAVFSTPSQSVT